MQLISGRLLFVTDLQKDNISMWKYLVLSLIQRRATYADIDKVNIGIPRQFLYFDKYYICTAI